MSLYKLFWDDFCAMYLEIVKPAYGEKIDGATYRASLGFFDSLLKLLHPFMPFITEELWHNLEERAEGETIMNQQLPKAQDCNEDLLAQFAVASEVIMNVRNIRQSKNISPKEALKLSAKEFESNRFAPVIRKLANISEISYVKDFGEINGQTFLVGTMEFYVPLEGHINVEQELAKINEDIAYYTKFLASVRAKLSNEKFVSKAPANVVAIEKKKESDALSKLETLNARLAALSK